jgi:predicted dehydrogenase
VRILVAGGGAFGKQHLGTLTAIGGMTLALAETRHAERKGLAEKFSLADHDADAFSLLERFAPHGVVIATPASAHAPLAIAALRRGVPVLVEKPVAPDTETMSRLCDEDAASSAFLQPGHILRFSAIHRSLHGIVRRGEIGQMLNFGSQRFRDEGHASRYAGIDPVLMTMIHDIDLALWFDGGAALSADATRSPRDTSRSLTTTRLASSSGATWQLATAWLHPGPVCPPDRIEVFGTEGSATLEVGQGITVHGKNSRHIPVDGVEDPLRNELDCFITGIRAGASVAPVTPQDALNGLLAAEMILRSLSAR